VVAWEGDFWGDFDLSSGFYDRYYRDCQDMDFFVWDLSIEVIYTSSTFNFTAPLSVIRAYRLIVCRSMGWSGGILWGYYGY